VRSQNIDVNNSKTQLLSIYIGLERKLKEITEIHDKNKHQQLDRHMQHSHKYTGICPNRAQCVDVIVWDLGYLFYSNSAFLSMSPYLRSNKILFDTILESLTLFHCFEMFL